MLIMVLQLARRVEEASQQVELEYELASHTLYGKSILFSLTGLSFHWYTDLVAVSLRFAPV